MKLLRRGTRAFCALAAAAVVTACGSDRDVDAEPPSSPAATVSPRAADETDAILAAYREFFNRQTEISLASKGERRALLEPFTTDPALRRVLSGMFAADELDEVGYGRPVLNPRVESIDGNRATVKDCQDNSQVGRKKVGSGKVTTRGFERDHANVDLTRGADGNWRVSTVEYADEKC